jgi:hypothetical protein
LIFCNIENPKQEAWNYDNLSCFDNTSPFDCNIFNKPLPP